MNQPHATQASPTERDSPCYIARHKCGLIVAAVVIDSTAKGVREVAKHLADWEKRGDTIEIVNSSEVRAGTWCGCFDKKRQRAREMELSGRPASGSDC
jgi:hypothetical protein